MVNNELCEYEKIILEYLNKSKKSMSIRKLSKKINLSYPTALKYIGTLELKERITIRNMGNVKLVGVKDG